MVDLVFSFVIVNTFYVEDRPKKRECRGVPTGLETEISMRKKADQGPA